MKKFKGFTLVELMIALSIIGILSALVLPMMSNNSPSKNKMMMKKAYFTIEDVVSNLVSDLSLYPEINSSGNQCVGFDNTDSVTVNSVSYSGATKFAKLFANNLNVDGDVSTSDNKVSFITNDGLSWEVTGATSSPPTEITTLEPGSKVWQTITVDVNGAKKPNCVQGESACSGRTDGFDKFTVYVSHSGKVVPKSGQTYFVEAIGVGSDLNGD